MFKSVLFFFILMGIHLNELVAQDVYKGVVLDEVTQQPIPYVNIGIVDKGIGTVSDEEGIFYLSLASDKITEEAILQFSSLGYQKIEMSVSNSRYVLNEFPNIKMRPATIELNEVVVSDTDLVPITDYVGYQNTDEGSFGYWKDVDALGGELATRIVANKTPRKLESLAFEVLQNSSDSLLLRVNVYDIKKNQYLPNENLNRSNENILFTLRKSDLTAKIDLAPYNISVEDDFFISLELVQRFSETPIELVLAASDSEAGSYRRYASQGKWEKISDLNMAFYVETSILVNQKKAKRYEAKLTKAALDRNMVSGYTLFGGRMIPDVTVYNKRTKESTISDEKGRYAIHADKNDILYFTKSGHKTVFIKIGKQQFANAILPME